MKKKKATIKQKKEKLTLKTILRAICIGLGTSGTMVSLTRMAVFQVGRLMVG